jgi:hypothetical protein
MEASRDPHTRAVERSAWWMRSEMGLRAASDPPVAGPLPARCDLHGLGHASGVRCFVRQGGQTREV